MAVRRARFSLLSISQDPLLTILAVVLLSMLWLVLPGVGSPDSTVIALHNDLGALRDQKVAQDTSIAELTQQRARLDELLAKAENGGAPNDASAYQAAGLETEVARRQAELAGLERLLQEAANAAAGSASRASSDSERKAQADELKRAIEAARAGLATVERQIEAAERAAAVEREKQDQTRSETAHLQGEVKAKEATRDQLKQELTALAPKTVITGDSIFRSQKKAQNIQLINNRLFPVDDEHYQIIESGYVREGTGQVKAARTARRPSAAGDNLQTVGRPQSKLSKVLATLTRNEQRIVFYVHGNSFEMLRKAREIVAAAGVEVGWWPFEAETFIVSSGSGGSTVPSTGTVK